MRRSGLQRGAPARAWRFQVGVLPLLLLACSGVPSLAWADSGQAARIAALEEAGRARPDLAFDTLDSLRTGLAPGDPDLLDVLRIQGRLASRLGRPEVTERVVAQIEQMAEANVSAVRRAESLATARCLRADQMRLTGPQRSADGLFDEVLSDLNSEVRSTVRLTCLMGSASVKENLGQFEGAVQRYQDAIRLADGAGLNGQRASLRTSLANVLKRAGQVEQGFVVTAEARRIAEQYQDWMSLSEAATVHAILLTDLGRTQEELDTLQQAIDYARRAGAPRDEGLGLANLADYYLQRGDYARALALAREALPLSQAAHDPVGEKLAIVNSGLALIALHRKDEGVRLVRQSIDDDRRSDEVVSMAESLQELGRYLETAGYLADAYAAFREHRAVADEVALRARQHAIAEMQESFEADRRRRERALLSDDNQIKEEQLRRQALQFRLWALIAALAGVLLLLVLLLYGRLRKTQQQLRHHHDHLKAQSEQDPLTGLANRRQGQAVMARQPMAHGTLYLLDLDHFKRINDRFGHAAGDAVLVEVAKRLRAVVREEDQVIRWGGEEFLIIVGSSTAEQTELLAQRLLAALAALPVLVGSRHIAVTASIGHADFPLQPQQLEVPWELALDLVDGAMYLGKTQGRNRACGVHRLPAHNLEDLRQLLQDVDGAWRDGRLQLSEWAGPDSVGEVA